MFYQYPQNKPRFCGVRNECLKLVNRFSMCKPAWLKRYWLKCVTIALNLFQFEKLKLYVQLLCCVFLSRSLQFVVLNQSPSHTESQFLHTYIKIDAVFFSSFTLALPCLFKIRYQMLFAIVLIGSGFRDGILQLYKTQ